MNYIKSLKLFGRGLHLTLTSGLPLQGLDGEVLVALGAAQAHGHRPVVLRCCADVPAAVGHRDQGADVPPGDMFVEEKPHQFAVRGDAAQAVLVLHSLRRKKTNIRRFEWTEL